MHFRRVCCQDRTNNTQISVGNSYLLESNNDNITQGKQVFYDNRICGKIEMGRESLYDSYHVPCDPPAIGQYVVIQKLEWNYLEIAEVDVIEVKDITKGQLYQYFESLVSK